MEETVVAGRKAKMEGDQVKRHAELTATNEETDTKVIQEWLRNVDKPLVSKIEKMSDHTENYPVQVPLEEEVENDHADTNGDYLQFPESTSKEIIDFLAEIDREYFQDN